MSKFVNDRLQGAVEVEKAGDCGPDTWRERWGHREEGRVKWASKQGSNSDKSTKWSEEWVEHINLVSNAKEKLKCKKWCRNESSGLEWTERWGEYDLPNKKEKWCDKW